MLELVVKVIQNSTGKPIKGKYVSVNCDELFSLWTSAKVTSDNDGMSKFSVRHVGFKGSISVNGEDVFKGKVMAFNTIYL
jgi:hypothetical protein